MPKKAEMQARLEARLSGHSGMRIWLRITAGPHCGRSFCFDKHDTFLVGRSDKAHASLPFKDTHLSRLHFLIEINPPRCRLLDLGSSNGTFVNGVRVNEAELKQGDSIRAGRTTLALEIEEIAREPQTAAQIIAPPSPVTLLQAARPEAPPKLAASTSGSISRIKPPSFLCSKCSRGPLCDRCAMKASRRTQPIPGFKLVQVIGRGGMGIVHAAYDEGRQELVALKTIVPDCMDKQDEVQRFFREARILRYLEHPNIVPFLDMGLTKDVLYFVMELVRGRDAASIVAREGAIEVERAVGWILQVLEGLGHAHEQGVVHRDIKSGNLLVSSAEGKERVHVADFGLARIYHETSLSGLTLQSHVGGTLDFIAPEQVLDFRNAKPAADQYAVAATLYHLLTCRYIRDLPSAAYQQLKHVLEEEPIPIRSRKPELRSRA